MRPVNLHLMFPTMPVPAECDLCSTLGRRVIEMFHGRTWEDWVLCQEHFEFFYAPTSIECSVCTRTLYARLSVQYRPPLKEFGNWLSDSSGESSPVLL